MRLTSYIKQHFAIGLLACMSTFSHAASVDIIGADSAEIQKTVIGVWAANERISFSKTGTYSILLTDFGLTKPNFGDSFNYVGAMISSTSDNIASVTLNRNSDIANAFLSFDITEGEYWLSMFAITDGKTNVGTFNFSVFEGDISPVPLPATFWLMATSLLGLVSFVRQSKASKKS